MNIRTKTVAVTIMLLIVFLGGILGYELIEGWSFLDATYMTVITLATIGFGETHPLSDAGRIFTIFLILGGMGTVSYGLITLTALVAEGELALILKQRRMDKAISALSNHYIVCGAGKTGSHIISELLNVGKQIVVIDCDADNLKKFQSHEAMFAHFGKKFDYSKALFIEGDVSSDEILLEAGILKAEGIFCALSCDKDNLFVVLSAKGLNNKIRIVSKCIDEESDQKFARAGADTIVSPNRIGGLRMASEMIRPTAVTFLDIMLRDHRSYRFEEIRVQSGSPFIGKSIRQSPLGSDPRVRILAMTNDEKSFHFNPPEESTIQPGNRFVVLGQSELVENLRRSVNKAA